jgi:hypothetical protein
MLQYTLVTTVADRYVDFSEIGAAWCQERYFLIIPDNQTGVGTAFAARACKELRQEAQP